MSDRKQFDLEAGKRIAIDKFGRQAQEAIARAGGAWLIESRLIGDATQGFPYAEIVAASTAEAALDLFEKWDRAFNRGTARYENKFPIAFNADQYLQIPGILAEP